MQVMADQATQVLVVSPELRIAARRGRSGARRIGRGVRFED